MSKLVLVGMADYKLGSPPDRLTTLGLGSCMGIALYSDQSKWCGLAHIMLPDSRKISLNENRKKFADTCLLDMYEELKLRVGFTAHFYAKVAGGARMFAYDSDNELLNIAEQNIQAVHEFLAQNEIPIVAEDVGKDLSRTIIFDPERTVLHINALGIGEYEI